MDNKLKEEIRILEISDDAYPDKLRNIEDPPKKIFCIGNIELLHKKGIGIVGSRKASEYGKRVAMKIGNLAAENDILVIGGMAKGIDSFGHIGVLAGGGETIAVLGSGVDVCYPKENQKLYDEIKKKGLIISEYDLGQEPRPYMFPKRNRIIVGLSENVVVVEAGTNSGSLITAEIAAEQGKEVFAVPGNITAHFSLGTNKLIADGAKIVTVIPDIFMDLVDEINIKKEIEESLGEDEKIIYEIVKKCGEISIDNLCNVLNKNVVEINGILTVLEMKGILAYSFGKIFLAKF